MYPTGASGRSGRTFGLIVLLVGAVGSVGLLLYAGRSSPQRLVIALIAIWVLSPFVVLAWANLISKNWSGPARAALRWLTLIVPLGSLAIYGYDALRPPRAKPAALFVAVPPVSWLLIAVVISIAAISARRQDRR